MSVLLNALFLPLLVILALAAVRVRDLVGAVLTLSAYGLVMSLVWAGMGAVDVAFTEAVVGAGASTVFFLATLLHTERTDRSRARPTRAVGLAAVLLLGSLLFFATHQFPAWGDPASPPSLHVSPRYLRQGYEETGAPNIVTAVLADYRGYDTLIETLVIFTAGLACWLLLRRREP
jgi:multicomponent Na+:H+ antiporter subunit B